MSSKSNVGLLLVLVAPNVILVTDPDVAKRLIGMLTCSHMLARMECPRIWATETWLATDPTCSLTNSGWLPAEAPLTQNRIELTDVACSAVPGTRLNAEDTPGRSDTARVPP